MSSDAFVAGVTFKIGDGGGPENFTALEEVTDIPEFGSVHDLVAVTHFGSGGHKEYTAGLMEGDELTITCNKVLGATQQDYVTSQKGNKGNIQVDITDGTTTETYQFEVLYLGSKPGPSLEDKNTVMFRMKINSEVITV